MTEREWLAERFEADRNHLRGVAYRMLGSLSEADDAVQETWIRLSRADTSDVENLTAWLTTVVARVSLDMLRSRKSRREELYGEWAPEPVALHQEVDPEQEALLADSVGLAMLVVLETLTPAERLAFVLHDMFAVPFDEIAPIVGRSPGAARQLASRARRRVQGPRAIPDADLNRKREIVDAFLAAARQGDFAALLEVLDPDVVIRIDDPSRLPGVTTTEIRGAEPVARRAIAGRARAARPVFVNGDLGVLVAPRGRFMLVMQFTVSGGKIVEIDVTADPDRLNDLDLAVPND